MAKDERSEERQAEQMITKRYLTVFLVAVLMAGVVLGGCAGSGGQNEQPGPQQLSAEETAMSVLQALKDRDAEALAQYVNPEKGVRFTPYPYVNPDTDIVLNLNELKGAFDDTTVRNWGTFDGSGEPINMTFADYYDRFIYDHDYLNAEKVGVNEFIGKGNTTNNARDIYPDATIIEYHFSGFDPKYSGMDWRSLRLVLEQKDDHWYLIGVIHAEWTI